MTDQQQPRTAAQQVEKTVVCTKCGHPVWFMAEEREATTCTDCGTVNLRAQPDISETDDEEFATAALVAALADTVAEQEQTLDDWTHLVHARLETHSHRISQSNSMLVKAVTELCDLVDWLAVGTVHMIGVDACSQINERTAALRALESPASAPECGCNNECDGSCEKYENAMFERIYGGEAYAPEPDPLCQNCGHPKSMHSPEQEARGDYCCIGDGTNCDCSKFVSQASPATAHQEPSDEVLVCQCGHSKGHHHPYCHGNHEWMPSGCRCREFVPQPSPATAHQEPPDAVLVAIISDAKRRWSRDDYGTETQDEEIALSVTEYFRNKYGRDGAR